MVKLSSLGIVSALLLGAATAPAQLTATRVHQGLNQPLGYFPDPIKANRAFIIQKGGVIRTEVNGALTATNFASLGSGVLSTSGERGLLGLAFHPNYVNNHFVYLYTTNPNGDIQIVRYTTNPAGSKVQSGTRTSIIRIPHRENDNHNGGTVTFGPDGYLYFGTGDGGSGNDPDNNAQNLGVLLGKMIRIDVDHDAFPNNTIKNYAIPSGNPFNAKGTLKEIWAYGLRNPFRWSFDSLTGNMLIADVGQGSREEIDVIGVGQGGLNFGWRPREGFIDNPSVGDPAPANATNPIFDYSHSVGQCITGGIVYRGNLLPSGYVGRYFYADFVARRIWSLDPYATNVANSVTEHTSELGQLQVAFIGPNRQGEMMVCDLGGSIWRIVDDPGASIVDWLNRPM